MTEAEKIALWKRNTGFMDPEDKMRERAIMAIVQEMRWEDEYEKKTADATSGEEARKWCELAQMVHHEIKGMQNILIMSGLYATYDQIRQDIAHYQAHQKEVASGREKIWGYTEG